MYPCANSLLLPQKMCCRWMHTLWQMIICTQTWRNEDGLWYQWMGQMREGCLLTLCLCGAYKEKDCASWGLVWKHSQLDDATGWHWCYYSLKSYYSLKMYYGPCPLPAMPVPSSMSPIPWADSAFSQWPFTGVKNPPVIWMLKRKSQKET